MDKYKKHIVRSLVALALIFVLYFLEKTPTEQTPIPNLSESQSASTTIATSTSTSSLISSLPSDATGPYAVAHVVDGDTISILKDGKSATVRLIGINTPETVDPRRPVECFGKEASSEAKKLLNGAKVYLEADASQGTYDKYGRMLAYVFLSDGTNFNQKLLAEGFAYEYTYDLPYKYQKEFKAAEANARANALGLWSPSTCGGKKTTTSARIQKASPVAAAVANFAQANGTYICDRNAYNCTSFKTHSEAQAVYESCGGVSNDIHKLDQDGDDLACETLP